MADDDTGQGPAERPAVPGWLAIVAIAAVFIGSLIESTRRAVRSAVATVRQWLHLT